MPTMSPALYVVEVQRLQRLVGDVRPAVGGRRRRRQHEQPARRDDADAEREMTWIDEMDGHTAPFTASITICGVDGFGRTAAKNLSSGAPGSIGFAV